MSIQNATTSAKPMATKLFTTPAPMATTPVVPSRTNDEAQSPSALRAWERYSCTVLFDSTSA